MQEASTAERVIHAAGGHYFELIWRRGDEDKAADVVLEWMNDPRLPFGIRDADRVGDEIRGRN